MINLSAGRVVKITASVNSSGTAYWVKSGSDNKRIASVNGIKPLILGPYTNDSVIEIIMDVGNYTYTFLGSDDQTPTKLQVSQLASVPKLQLVGCNHWQNTGKLRNTTANGNTGYNQYASRCNILIGKERVSNLCLAFTGWYEDNSGAGIAFPGASHDLRAAIETPEPYSGAGVSYQKCFFGGQSLKTIEDGVSFVMTDPVPYDFAGYSTISTRCGAKVANITDYVPTGGIQRSSSSPVDQMIMSLDTTEQIYATGTLSNPAGGLATSAVFRPFALLGVPANPMPAVGIMADSFGEGTGDSPWTLYGVQGYLQRGLNLINGTDFIPNINLSKGSSAVRKERTIKTQARFILPYVSHVLAALGRNDIGVSTVAQVQTGLQQLWDFLHTIVGLDGKPLRVTQVLFPPSTTSSDNWATYSGQTVVAGFEVGGKRDQLNAWILTKLADGTIEDVIDPNVAWEGTGVNHGKWIADGTTANLSTPDGIHPSVVRHADAAVIVRAWAANISL